MGPVWVKWGGEHDTVPLFCLGGLIPFQFCFQKIGANPLLFVDDVKNSWCLSMKFNGFISTMQACVLILLCFRSFQKPLQAQLLAQDDENAVAVTERTQSNELLGDAGINGNDPSVTDDEVRKMLADIFTDNARLRKQVNSIIRCALKTAVEPEKEEAEEAPSRKTVLNKFLER